MNDELNFQQQSLFQQGYQSYTAAELKQLEWGLRFTPAACTSLTILSLIMQWPALAFMVSVLGIWAFFFPAAHPMDLFYNSYIRHVFNAAALPPNPLQRRMACLSAGILNFLIAVFFISESYIAAYSIGIMLVILQLIVITSHFCMLSWIYEGIMRILGRWELPLSPEEAQKLLDQGAQLIDVRSAVEFAKSHTDGAINIPVDNIIEHTDALSDQTSLLCCASGLRSQIAHKKLIAAGVSNVYDIGSISKTNSLSLSKAK